MCRKYHNAGDLFEPEVESNVRKDLRLERCKAEQEEGERWQIDSIFFFGRVANQ